MAATRQILQRREAAENIGKVTHTMETVSAVRYRQYFRRWSQGADFYDALAELAYLMVAAERTIPHPLMLANKSDRQAIIVTGSDRGLCGAYNSNILKLLEVHRKSPTWLRCTRSQTSSPGSTGRAPSADSVSFTLASSRLQTRRRRH